MAGFDLSDSPEFKPVCISGEALKIVLVSLSAGLVRNAGSSRLLL